MKNLRCLLPLLFAARLAADPAPLPDGLYAEFTTPRGVFTAELFYQQAPMTVASFVGRAEGSLAQRDGQPFFTGLTWYRVVPGFVIQSGDPTNPGGGIQSRPQPTPEDDAAGHPFPFPDEIVPGLHHDAAGTLSMANGGPDTNSSEFFVTLADTTRLNYLHSVFGRTVRGADVVPLIQLNDAFAIKILRVGAAAQAFKADEATFKSLVEKAGKYSGAKECGPTTHFDDPDKVLPQEIPRAKNFNFKLANFQRFTGQRLYARTYATLPQAADATEKTTPAKFTQKLARELGIAKNGALAVYFADRDDWYLWVGDDLTPTFNPEKKKLMARKTELYNAVKKMAAGYAADARKLRGPENPLTPADLAKYSVDAMLDSLIFLFEPQPKT
ncbi:MAG: peptidylprolyl isomerase [Opitutae bacterium]|nr:peptidylprolyl isomerase [Opitutae bacterium]